MSGSSVFYATEWRGSRSGQAGGASPLFPPKYPTSEAAKAGLETTLHQHPEHFGIDQTRWTLKALLRACDWLKLQTLAGLHQLLKRLKIHRKRGRGHLYSPDAAYKEKLRDVRLWIRVAQPLNPNSVVVFSDEMTFYRQPSLSWEYERAGPVQPLAELGYRSNLAWRIAGALNVWTGQLTYAEHEHFTRKLLVDFYQQLAQTYPQAQTIYVVVDNWPVHFHPDVLAAFCPYPQPWPIYHSRYWPDAPSTAARYLDLPIQLIPLPTYAPWTNPIEKLWRLLKQTVLHLHRFADDWDGLRLRVHQELEQYVQPSTDLLRYVGLEDPLRLYQTLFAAK